MPLIKGFQSTNIWKAFTLNSLASSLVIMVAVTIKDRLDDYKDNKGDKIYRETNTFSMIITLIVTFIASMSAYTILYVVFGYGGGQLVNE